MVNWMNKRYVNRTLLMHVTLPPNQPPNSPKKTFPPITLQVGCCAALHPLGGVGHKTTTCRLLIHVGGT
jgi:hypothetical protein